MKLPSLVRVLRALGLLDATRRAGAGADSEPDRAAEAARTPAAASAHSHGRAGTQPGEAGRWRWGDERAARSEHGRGGRACGAAGSAPSRSSDGADVAAFQYDPAFLASGIEVAPLVMPLRRAAVHVPGARATRRFHGLPGLLADSLPDRYGNALIDAWLARAGTRRRRASTRSSGSATSARAAWARSSSPRRRGPRRDARAGHRDRRARRARLRGAHRTARTSPRRFADGARTAGDARHPQRRHLGRRRAREGGDRLEPGDERGALRPGRRRPGLRVLAAEVRRRQRQQGQGARGPAGLRRDRVRLLADGARRRHRDEPSAVCSRRAAAGTS